MPKVHCDWSASGFQVIADADYDPATHRLYSEPKPAPPAVAPPPVSEATTTEDAPVRRRKG